MHIDDGQRTSVHITHDVLGSSHLCCTLGGILGVMVPLFSFVRSSSLFALVTVISCLLLPSSGLLFLRLVSEPGKFGSIIKGSVSVRMWCGDYCKFRAIYDLHGAYARSSVDAWWS